jgi:hypothetical protein
VPITISRITVTNPCLFRHGEDLDKSVGEARFLVHDSMEDVLVLEGEVIWIKIAQLCSVMSVYWIQGKVGVPFRSLSTTRQIEIANVVVGNNTPRDQFNWALDQLKYTETTDEDAAAKLPAGSKVLLYTPRHVCAAIVTIDDKWLIYDPETASAEEYSVKDVKQLYLSHSTRFLHGK